MMRFAVAALAAISGLAVTSVAGAGMPSVDPWERAFPATRVTRSLHMRATYRDAAAAEHSLELWRDGNARIRRDTDARMTVIVQRDATDELDFRVFDRSAHVALRVTRSNLARIGQFSSWENLSRVIGRPETPFQLEPAATVRLAQVGTCRTWILKRDGLPEHEICWSTRWSVPLRIRERVGSGNSVETFSVLTIDAVAAASAFEFSAAEYVPVDANEEIDPRGD
jgi:hypothetical protein